MTLTDSLNASPDEIAHAAGATDLFVLRRIEAGRFAHVGGVGRGVGWAGIVEADDAELAPTGNPVGRSRSDEPAHVFGPYWARWSTIVRVDPDLVVVFGGQDTPADLDDDQLIELARQAVGVFVDVSPAKRLADELEVLTAVQGLLRQPPETTREMLERLAAHATRALSCELGLAYLADEEMLALCDLRGGPELSYESVRAAGAELATRTEFPTCMQEAAAEELPAPFSAADGVHSYYLLELKPPVRGILLVAHTTAAPARGFTSLCQTLGQQLVEAAQPLLTASLIRDTMQHNLARAEADARRDALTGLANRLAWTEACANVRGTGDSPVAIVVVDAGRLKAINETYGHHVGDDLLRAIADALHGCVRET
ncbi:MAG: diguanylate cyclase, partial [Actinobacteria bacterium]|nr:diguanylate cyclase [Actinomycetota bacterium]